MAEPIIVSGNEKPSNRRVKIIGVVGVALVLVLVVFPKLSGGGGGGGDVTEFPSTRTPRTTVAAPGDGDAVPETFQGFTSKNPFKPLIAIGGGTGGGVPVVTPPSDTPTTLPPDFSQPPATIPDDGSGGGAVVPTTDPGPTTTTVPPRQPDRVGLLEIYRDPDGAELASVRVNDTTYQVHRGDRFATSYQVISLDIVNRCGDFLFGDDRFRLCEGDEVRK
jgi:hypothetical protein